MTKEQPAINIPELPDTAYSAIESEALRRGVSVEEACLQILLEKSRALRERPRLTTVARLFRFARVH